MVTPAGVSADTSWSAMLDGKNCKQEIPAHWHEYHKYRSTVWSCLQDIDFKEFGFSRSEILQKDPFSLISLIASSEAVENSELEVELVDKKANRFALPKQDSMRSGVFIGTTIGGGSTYINITANHVLTRIAKMLESGLGTVDEVDSLIDSLSCPKSYSPFSVPMIMANSVSASIGMKYSLNGINRVIEHACSSGTTAIGMAFKAVQSGECDYVICGGTDYYKDDFGMNFRAFDLARTLACLESGSDISEINRPFDRDRNGFLFAGGGAASLILESEAHLDKRQGNPVAEVVGFGETFDAHSIMAPEPGGKQIERMMRIALNDAGIEPEQMGYINAHGTGTVANDQTESEVIGRVFGDNVPVNSTKSIIGHTLGASGAIEAVVCVLSLKNQQLHPSLNIDNPISELDFITEKREADIKYAFSQSFAFGGHNSGLVFKSV